MNVENTALPLFILRLGLALFLLLWSLDKFMEPDSTVKIFGHFYGLSISIAVAYGAGFLEGALSIAILAGYRKTLSYGLGLLLHTVSTLSTYQQLLSPFGQNHLFIAAIPVLAAFVTLFLLRDQDTLWAVAATPIRRKR